MKRLHRWAALVIALLIAAGPVFAPREGRAGPARGQYLPGDPRPTAEMGEPEVPPTPCPSRGNQVPMPVLLIARTGRLDLMVVFVLMDAHVESKPTSVLSTSRTRI
jgi:hypothetical protein